VVVRWGFAHKTNAAKRARITTAAATKTTTTAIIIRKKQ